MKLILVRHGETLKLKDEERALTLNGKMQAKKVGEKLKDYSIDKIYCSTMKRAKQTAEIISTILEKRINFDQRLCERNPSKESNEEFIQRCKSFLSDAQYFNGNILLVAHGGTNKTILSICTADRKKGAELFNLIKQNHANINIIEFDSPIWNIKEINLCDHLNDGK